VRTRNINLTHTRLPRYARGKLGMIERDHGVFVSPTATPKASGRSRSTYFGAFRRA
jgi:nitrile hydratase